MNRSLFLNINNIQTMISQRTRKNNYTMMFVVTCKWLLKYGQKHILSPSCRNLAKSEEKVTSLLAEIEECKETVTRLTKDLATLEDDATKVMEAFKQTQVRLHGLYALDIFVKIFLICAGICLKCKHNLMLWWNAKFGTLTMLHLVKHQLGDTNNATFGETLTWGP